MSSVHAAEALLRGAGYDYAAFSDEERLCLQGRIDAGEKDPDAAVKHCAPARYAAKYAAKPAASADLPAPPTKFDASQNADGTWTVKGVPVFVEHNVKDKRGGGESYHVGEEWMRAALAKSRARMAQDGYLAPLHENHHGQGEPTKPLGEYVLTDVKRMPYEGKPRWTLFAEYRLRPEAYERFKRGDLPYRSAEVLRLDAKELDSIALLPTKVPFFRLAPHRVGNEQRFTGQPQQFTAADPIVAYRPVGFHGYSLLMRYDDMPDQLPTVEVPGAPAKAPEKHNEGGGQGDAVSILSQIGSLIQQAIDALKGGGKAPEAQPSQAPAPVEPMQASASARGGSPELYALRAEIDLLKARDAQRQAELEAEKKKAEASAKVDEVYREVERYGLHGEQCRAKLRKIYDEGGLPALLTYSAAVKELAVQAPPSGYAGPPSDYGNGRPALAKPDPSAEKYAALGPKAVEIAYQAGKGFDELAQRGDALPFDRDEHIALTLEAEGYQVPAASINGTGR